MKLVFINRYFWPDHSSTSQLLSALAFNLATHGHEVAVISSRQLYEAPDAQLPEFEVVRKVSVYRVGGSRFGRASLLGRSLDYLSFARLVRRELQRTLAPGDVVVAKTDPPMLGSLVMGTIAKSGAHLVNWLQDLFPEVAQRAGVRFLKGPLASTLRQLRDKSLRRAALNVAVGEGMAEYLMTQCGVPRNRIRVIPNWADGEAIRPEPREANPLRREWGLQGKFVVGYSGNLGRVHEHLTILGAMRQLSRHEGIRFLFVGSGSGLAQLRDKVENERLKNALFRPYQKPNLLSQSLGAADVHLCVLRPEFEGLVVPSKFYGIVAAGRPTIYVGDPLGEIPAIIRRSGCGRSVSAGNVETLVSEIASYASDELRLEREGGNARLLFETSYDQRIALATWVTTASELLRTL